MSSPPPANGLTTTALRAKVAEALMIEGAEWRMAELSAMMKCDGVPRATWGRQRLQHGDKKMSDEGTVEVESEKWYVR